MPTIDGVDALRALPWLEIVGYLGSLFTLVAYSMRNMRSLRIVALASNICSLCYGLVLGIWPMAVLHGLLLPLNAHRLFEIERTARRLRLSRKDPLSVLTPFLSPREATAGTVLFRRGDRPERVYYLKSGRVHLPEIDVTLTAGALFGEMAYFGETPERTTSAVCRDACEIMELDDRIFMKLFNQHPDFGFYIIRLMAARLLEGGMRDPTLYTALTGPGSAAPQAASAPPQTAGPP